MLPAHHLFILAQFCPQKMRIGQTCIFAPLLHSSSCVREQCSNVWVSHSRKQHLFWIPASVETFKTARHSCAVRCMSSSSAPGVPAVLSTRTVSPVRWSMPSRPRDLELLKELYLTEGTCCWDAGSASVHFSGCSQWSSGQHPPPQTHHTQASLGRPTSGLPWFLLLPQLPSPLANWVWLFWVVLVGGGMHNSPSGEPFSQVEFLRDWSLIIHQ